MDFRTFQKFDKKEDALYLSEILEQNDIDSFIEDTGNPLDSTLGNSQFTLEYALKIKQVDFERAERLSNIISNEGIGDVDEDYFLFQFTNEELKDVILKKDEWGNDNYALAKKILKDRGVVISQKEMDDLQADRLIELAKPDKIQAEWIVVGYVFAILGGVLGVLTGWYLMTLKKTLPNGERVYSYLPSDRKHGKRIFFIGLVFAAIFITIRIIKTLKLIE